MTHTWYFVEKKHTAVRLTRKEEDQAGAPISMTGKELCYSRKYPRYLDTHMIGVSYCWASPNFDTWEGAVLKNIGFSYMKNVEVRHTVQKHEK
jgi:hypothetical protein